MRRQRIVRLVGLTDNAVIGLSGKSAKPDNAAIGLSEKSAKPDNAVIGLSGKSVKLDNAVIGLSEKSAKLDNAVIGLSEKSAKLDNAVIGLFGKSAKPDNAVIGLSGKSAKLDNAVIGLSEKSAKLDNAVIGWSGRRPSRDRVRGIEATGPSVARATQRLMEPRVEDGASGVARSGSRQDTSSRSSPPSEARSGVRESPGWTVETRILARNRQNRPIQTQTCDVSRR